MSQNTNDDNSVKIKENLYITVSNAIESATGENVKAGIDKDFQNVQLELADKNVQLELGDKNIQLDSGNKNVQSELGDKDIALAHKDIELQTVDTTVNMNIPENSMLEKKESEKKNKNKKSDKTKTAKSSKTKKVDLKQLKEALKKIDAYETKLKQAQNKLEEQPSLNVQLQNIIFAKLDEYGEYRRPKY